MIQMQTKLVVADNTGAKEVSMIRRLGQRTRIAHVGDVIVVAVKSSTPGSESDCRQDKGSDTPQRRLVSALRLQRGRNSRRLGQPEGHAYFWPCRPRIALQKFHENHFPRTGGTLI